MRFWGNRLFLRLFTKFRNFRLNFFSKSVIISITDYGIITDSKTVETPGIPQSLRKRDSSLVKVEDLKNIFFYTREYCVEEYMRRLYEYGKAIQGSAPTLYIYLCII